MESIKTLRYIPLRPGRKSSKEPSGAKHRPMKTNTIGLLLSSEIMSHYTQGDPYYARLINGIYLAVEKLDRHLMIGIHRKGKAVLPAFVAQEKVDALLVDDILPPSLLAELYARRIPVVFIDKAPLPGGCSVEANMEVAVFQILTYLWDLGHRNIASFLVDDESPEMDRFASAYRRFFQWKKHVPQVGILNQRHGISSKTHTDVLDRYVEEVLKTTFRPTAIISWDTYAAYIQKGLIQHGIHVPKQISIVGLDDTLTATQTTPNLSSYRFPLEEIGLHAIALLLEMLNDPERSSTQLLLEGTLILRESSGPAPMEPGFRRSSDSMPSPKEAFSSKRESLTQ